MRCVGVQTRPDLRNSCHDRPGETTRIPLRLTDLRADTLTHGAKLPTCRPRSSVIYEFAFFTMMATLITCF
jgi:hypothetical protein